MQEKGGSKGNQRGSIEEQLIKPGFHTKDTSPLSLRYLYETFGGASWRVAASLPLRLGLGHGFTETGTTRLSARSSTARSSTKGTKESKADLRVFRALS
jgi:hypothetical protein